MGKESLLCETGRQKWVEYSAKLGAGFDSDTLLLLCTAWDTFTAAQKDVAANGVTYTDTKNGRTWNNPATHTLDVAIRQIVKLSKLLGLREEPSSGRVELP